VLEYYGPAIDATDPLGPLGLQPGQYILATMHRAESVDDGPILHGLCRAMVQVAETYELPLVLSVHPRVEGRLSDTLFVGTRVRSVPALGFLEFVKLEKHAALLLTDSGTVQEECAILRIPVITIRDAT